MEFSRAGMEAASLATNTVDEAVEQLVAGWTGAAIPGLAQQGRQSTRRSSAPQQPASWGSFDMDEEDSAQEISEQNSTPLCADTAERKHQSRPVPQELPDREQPLPMDHKTQAIPFLTLFPMLSVPRLPLARACMS